MIRAWLKLALFEKGIKRPIKNLEEQVGGPPQALVTYRGNLYYRDDPDHQLVLETRQEYDRNAERVRKEQPHRRFGTTRMSGGGNEDVY